MINIKETSLQSVFEIQLNHFKDERGSFIKYFNYDIFKKNNINL